MLALPVVATRRGVSVRSEAEAEAEAEVWVGGGNSLGSDGWREGKDKEGESSWKRNMEERHAESSGKEDEGVEDGEQRWVGLGRG